MNQYFYRPGIEDEPLRQGLQRLSKELGGMCAEVQDRHDAIHQRMHQRLRNQMAGHADGFTDDEVAWQVSEDERLAAWNRELGAIRQLLLAMQARIGQPIEPLAERVPTA